MHPFYGPNARLLARREPVAGVVSMAAYLAFWAAVVAIARRELDARFPRVGPDTADPALVVLRQRFAQGEISADELLEMRAVLDRSARL